MRQGHARYSEVRLLATVIRKSIRPDNGEIPLAPRQLAIPYVRVSFPTKKLMLAINCVDYTGQSNPHRVQPFLYSYIQI